MPTIHCPNCLDDVDTGSIRHARSIVCGGGGQHVISVFELDAERRRAYLAQMNTERVDAFVACVNAAMSGVDLPPPTFTTMVDLASLAHDVPEDEDGRRYVTLEGSYDSPSARNPSPWEQAAPGGADT